MRWVRRWLIVLLDSFTVLLFVLAWLMAFAFFLHAFGCA